MENDGKIFASVVLDYTASTDGDLPQQPYGGLFPGTFPVSVPLSNVLGPDAENGPVDFVSLPRGASITVGFEGAGIVDGPGDDLFIQESGAGGETALIEVSTDGVNFLILSIANDAETTAFDLGTLGLDAPVVAVRITGNDSFGGSPGFDVVNVQGLPGSVDFAAKVFLDFDTPIPRDFYLVTDTTTAVADDPETTEIDETVPARQFYASREGTEPLGSFDATFRNELVANLQAVFNRSGVNVEVVQERPAEGDFHTIRFSPSLGNVDLNQDGVADDRSLGEAFEGVDRFNKKGNDIVAVFMDQTTDSAAYIAAVTAHELGHGFGLRHVNPVPFGGSEVMDYTFTAAPVFHNGVTAVLEPPVDDPAVAVDQGVTHNPTYHLRRFVANEGAAAIEADGVMPGSYDSETVYQLHRLFLGFDTLLSGGPIAAIGIQRGSGVAYIEDNADAGEIEFDLIATDVTAGDTISFDLPEGEPFRIVASTEGTETFDSVFFFQGSRADGSVIATADLDVSGQLVQVSDGGATVVSLGTVSLEQTSTETVSAGSNAPIIGTLADDVLSGVFGDDLVRGNAGSDTMVYDLERGGVEETLDATGRVKVRLENGEVDTLLSIERVALTDGTYLYDLDNDATLQQTYRLYGASLGRAPDEAGLIFWDGARDGGFTLDQLAKAFVDAQEFLNLFGGAEPSSEVFIDALFLNVLGRSADAAGREFWINAFDAGTTRADMLVFFSESPENLVLNADNYDDGVWVI
ncbi:hypothetical protein LNKW23_16840 [Paralimibaculum aggregatum]|uniref:DUF4214 domain-containing protein n=1 Tax=Paralimibaculum aggregatum TaxID=3036245 RepID=A0ABQ6LGP0_9RHOB|nr:DUF4214 domain-containing protein [Limibaculum sp. NKW23]GMG82471.1 hypothetical protein LNKW23_16840 [Limibaculum sp. NKW23]